MMVHMAEISQAGLGNPADGKLVDLFEQSQLASEARAASIPTVTMNSASADAAVVAPAPKPLMRFAAPAASISDTPSRARDLQGGRTDRPRPRAL
jgi:hypothetical protein